MEPERIWPKDASRKIKAGSALLVCSYTDEGWCKANNLEGAIKFGDFKQKLPGLSKNQEIIFYCATPQEAVSADQAAKLTDLGYRNVKALGGGVQAWAQQVGFVWHSHL
ncbi:MAG: rhodanese-like domain-containing protein [Desulfobacteraceae bacterium]|nr:MAG: rhodanese-like domain-containing protein [Desulfobacteraceae bacterium]